MFRIFESLGVVIFIFLLACFIFGYGFYVTFIKENIGTVDLNMEIPKKVTMNNCCSVSKSAEAAYCFGGEGYNSKPWSSDKCDKAFEYLNKCDEKYTFDEIPC